MVSLYIENKLIELDSEVQFAITKTFEDITNPTSIINDWSKTVSIPFTDSNNEIFGHIYNPDRITLHTSNTSLTTGMYFDPLKKLNFRLEWDSMLLMQGYAKMTSITKSNGKGRYNITLNGELGKVFQEMKKITFDETAYTGTDKDKYWINGNAYTGEVTINAANIKRLWNTEQPYNDDIHNSNLINFAPNNSFSEGFDYTIYQLTKNSTEEFAEVLNNVDFTNKTGVEPKVVLPNGILPREIGEYRSYLQLPFIHFYKLFLIFKDKFESVSDYKIKLDEYWFNEHNPYWTDLVFMLKKLDISNNNILQNIYDMRLFGNPEMPGWDSSSSLEASRPTTTRAFDLKPMKEFSQPEKAPLVNWDLDIKPFKTSSLISTKTPYNLRLQVPSLYNNSKRETFKLNTGNALEITLKDNYISVNPNTSQYSSITSYSKKFLICDSAYTGNKTGYDEVIFVGEAENTSSGSYSFFNFSIPIELNLSKVIGENVYSYISIDAKWVNNVSMIYAVNLKQNIHRSAKLIASDQYFEIDIKELIKRSNSTYTLNDVWNNEYNLFEEILKYCKTYKILIQTDDVNKEISFMQSSRFFSNYTVKDWTNKLDLSKEFTVKPITFENKYILFNYEPSESKLNDLYKTKYGVNFGEYKLTTDYHFNTETKNLFDKIGGVIAETPYILSWSNLEKSNISYSFPNEVYISSSDKDSKEISVFGTLLFNNGLKYFDTEETLKLRPVSISDDTDYQIANNVYCYTQGSATTQKVEKYPMLSNISGKFSSTFALPMENYTSVLPPENCTDIYTAFWKNYLDERYNTNNKIVTCYLDIKPSDYFTFKFNQFIKIENQLYFINKIYDYDITNNSTTKVDLITVQDIKGYTDINFTLDYFKVYNTPDEVWDNHYNYIGLIDTKPSQTIYISSSSDINWFVSHIESGEARDVRINGERLEGEISKGLLVPVTFTAVKGNTSFTVTFTNSQGDSIDILVDCDVSEMPITTASNSVVKDYDTFYIGTDYDSNSVTVYVTSESPVEVNINDLNGDISDVSINGVDAIELWNGYDTVTLQAGERRPLTIGTLWGGSDFNIELYLSNGSTNRVFYVDCTM